MTPQHGTRTLVLPGNVTICALCRRHVTYQGGACPADGRVF